MTAVEWFAKQVLRSRQLGFISNEKFNELLEQAKEKEEKIIAQAFEDGEYNYFYSKKTGKEFENGIEYYNEKFKQQ